STFYVHSMMHINDLVDEVLALILDYAVSRWRPNIDNHGQRLRLLGVCRKWRFVLLPAVYRHVYVSYSNRLQIKQRAHSDRAGVSVFTNAGLAAANKCIDYCRHAIIQRQCLMGRFVDFSTSVNMLRQHSDCWSSVSELTVEFLSLSFRNREFATANDQTVAQFAGMAAEIAALMPNVVELRAKNNIDNTRTDVFLETLASAYRQRLLRLHYAISFALPDTLVLERLTHLDIMFTDAATAQLPRICRRTLEYLRLQALPHRFVCTIFGADSMANVEFPNLRYLQVASQMPENMDGDVKKRLRRFARKTRVHYPSLRHLELVNAYASCPILATAQLPRQLNVMSLVVSADSVIDLIKRGVPATNRLSVGLFRGRGCSHRELASAINHVYSSRVAYAELSLTQVPRLPRPHDIRGANIAELTISHNLGVQQMLEFMWALPALAKLDVNIDQTGKISTDLSDLYGGPAMCPRLVDLELDYEIGVAGEIVGLVKYLLLRLPRLQRLESMLTPKAPVAEFVEQHAALYPHLQFVRLILSSRSP
ncbi:hypothetical protein LPJ63_004508, partial [Coemansia sp. RSA 2711]